MDSKYKDLVDQADYLFAHCGKPRAALGKITKALKLRPDDAEALVIRGRILFFLDKTRSAQECFKRAVAIAPKYSQGYLELARGDYGLGRNPKQALRNTDKAVRFAANNFEKAEALRLKGLVLSALDRDDEATRCLRKALQIRPRDPEILWDLGDNLINEGKPQAALKHVDKALGVISRRRESRRMDLGFVLASKVEALNTLGRHKEAVRLAEIGLKQARDKDSKIVLRALRARTRRLCRA